MHRIFFCFFQFVPCLLLAIYAPLPEEEQGKLMTFQLDSGLRYDNNIFGAPSDRFDSFIWMVSPSGQLNYGIGDQGFFRGSYELEVNKFDTRPGEDVLYNHVAQGIFDYSFSERLRLTISDRIQSIDNPESVLVTGDRVLQSDQSFWDNQFKFRTSYQVTPKISTVVNAQYYGVNYENEVLARIVDRRDELWGVQMLYAILPELDGVGEIRYEKIRYDVDNAIKGSDSLFYLVGADYYYGEQFILQARTGLESRDRNTGGSRDAFYGNIAGVYRYAPGSVLTVGLKREIGEASNTQRFLDSHSYGFFVTGEHDLTGNGRLFASGAFIYELADLEGRESVEQPDIDETTARLGLSLIYKWKPSWKAVLSYDVDRIDSDDPFREQSRERVELYVSTKFGAGI